MTNYKYYNGLTNLGFPSQDGISLGGLTGLNPATSQVLFTVDKNGNVYSPDGELYATSDEAANTKIENNIPINFEKNKKEKAEKERKEKEEREEKEKAEQQKVEREKAEQERKIQDKELLNDPYIAQYAQSISDKSNTKPPIQNIPIVMDKSSSKDLNIINAMRNDIIAKKTKDPESLTKPLTDLKESIKSLLKEAYSDKDKKGLTDNQIIDLEDEFNYLNKPININSEDFNRYYKTPDTEFIPTPSATRLPTPSATPMSVPNQNAIASPMSESARIYLAALQKGKNPTDILKGVIASKNNDDEAIRQAIKNIERDNYELIRLHNTNQNVLDTDILTQVSQFEPYVDRDPKSVLDDLYKSEIKQQTDTSATNKSNILKDFLRDNPEYENIAKAADIKFDQGVFQTPYGVKQNWKDSAELVAYLKYVAQMKKIEDKYPVYSEHGENESPLRQAQRNEYLRNIAKNNKSSTYISDLTKKTGNLIDADTLVNTKDFQNRVFSQPFDVIPGQNANANLDDEQREKLLKQRKKKLDAIRNYNDKLKKDKYEGIPSIIKMTQLQADLYDIDEQLGMLPNQRNQSETELSKFFNPYVEEVINEGNKKTIETFKKALDAMDIHTSINGLDRSGAKVKWKQDALDKLGENLKAYDAKIRSEGYNYAMNNFLANRGQNADIGKVISALQSDMIGKKADIAHSTADLIKQENAADLASLGLQQKIIDNEEASLARREANQALNQQNRINRAQQELDTVRNLEGANRLVMPTMPQQEASQDDIFRTSMYANQFGQRAKEGGKISLEEAKNELHNRLAQIQNKYDTRPNLNPYREALNAGHSNAAASGNYGMGFIRSAGDMLDAYRDAEEEPLRDEEKAKNIQTAIVNSLQAEEESNFKRQVHQDDLDYKNRYLNYLMSVPSSSNLTNDPLAQYEAKKKIEEDMKARDRLNKQIEAQNAKIKKDAEESLGSVNKKLDNYNILQNSLNSAGITNVGGIRLPNAAKYMVDLAYPGNVSDATVADSIIAELAKQKHEKGEGTISDADREWFQKMVPNLSNPLKANKQMINNARAILERQKEADKLILESDVYGLDPIEAQKIVREFNNSNPVLNSNGALNPTKSLNMEEIKRLQIQQRLKKLQAEKYLIKNNLQSN